MNDKLKLRVTGYGLRVTITLLLTLSFFFIPSLIQYDKHSSADNLTGVSYVYADETEEDAELKRLKEDADPDAAEKVRILPECGGTGGDVIGSEKYDLNSFLWLLILILRWIFSITGSLAVLMFVYGGYLWLMSAGEEKRVKEGTSTMVNAVIGVAIILGSWLGVNVIVAAMTGAPGNIGTGSIAWNNVGVHCKGRTEPLKFFTKTPPPPEPPAVAGGAGTPPRPGTTTPPPSRTTPSPTPPPPPKKCTDPGAPPCPTGKDCDKVSGSPTYGKCIDIADGDCNPPCTGGKVCNKRTKQCETTPTGECCYTVLVEDDCVEVNTPPHMESAYLRPSTENLCTDQNLSNFSNIPGIGKEKERCSGMSSFFEGINRKIINRTFCEHKSCDHMNASAGTWTCK